MNKVKISTKKPPQWILDAVKEKWGIDWESGVIFTYGELISSYVGEMTEDLLAHETNHTVQQNGDPDSWWKRYLEDDEFRLSQELECYRKQYKWLEKNIKDRNEKFYFLNHYAKSLSGNMYGNLISYSEAIKKIRT
jgi:hypothetical protein